MLVILDALEAGEFTLSNSNYRAYRLCGRSFALAARGKLRI